jgi:hypothetical protein
MNSSQGHRLCGMLTIPKISEDIKIHLIANFYSCNTENIVHGGKRLGYNAMFSAGATITTVIISYNLVQDGGASFWIKFESA